MSAPLNRPLADTPILCVMFVHESGYVESYQPDEIRAEPDTFRAIMADHREAGRKPLVMRQRARADQSPSSRRIDEDVDGGSSK